jgi:NAD-dependent deacetylase
MTDPQPLQQARQWVQQAQRIAVLTGAGVSAESGVPTFRDAQTGLWANFRPEELATEEAFRSNPQRVWDWYAARREQLADVQPNAGHVALAEFQLRHPGRLTLITQNVDGLHQKAGSVDVLALHGDLMQNRWLNPCLNRDLHGGNVPACDIAIAAPGSPPQCVECGNLLRPAVVWFGEALPEATLAAAEHATSDCDLMLVAGTAGVVYPAAGLAHLAARNGARVIVLNTEPTDLDEVAHLRLAGPSAHWLPLLLADE